MNIKTNHQADLKTTTNTTTLYSQPIQDKLTRRERIEQLLLNAFTQEGVHKLLEWRNDDKERYYSLLAGKDLLGAQVLIREWGSSVTKQSQCLCSVVQPEKVGEVVNLVDGILKRRSLNGYVLLTEPELFGV